MFWKLLKISSTFTIFAMKISIKISNYMEINLLEIVKKQISGEILQKAAAFLGEDTNASQKALSAILPSVLGGVVNQSTSISSATNLMNTLTTDGHDGSIFNSLSNLLNGGSATQGLMASGDSIVKNLFGNKTSGIVDWIASYAGIKTGSASGLMSLVSPVVMGAIGKQISGGQTGVSGLINLLGGQTNFIKNALPSGLSSVLGLSNLRLDTPSVVSTAQAEKIASEAHIMVAEKSLLSKVLPWFILLLAGLGGMFYLKMCNTKAPEPPQATAVTEVPQVVAPMVDTIKKLALPEGDITVKTGSFLDQLYMEVIDTTLDPTKALTFDNVNFATGSADLTEGSKMQLNDLVKIMKGYPKVEIKVEGHTDNQGNEASNKKLSENRAASVKTYLASHGIAGGRMATAGFGSSKPVADNTNEEGRAKNRRIEAMIVKK
jgi:OmpA-OmpF porin, OOP family